MIASLMCRATASLILFALNLETAITLAEIIPSSTSQKVESTLSLSIGEKELSTSGTPVLDNVLDNKTGELSCEEICGIESASLQSDLKISHASIVSLTEEKESLLLDLSQMQSDLERSEKNKVGLARKFESLTANMTATQNMFENSKSELKNLQLILTETEKNLKETLDQLKVAEKRAAYADIQSENINQLDAMLTSSRLDLIKSESNFNDQIQKAKALEESMKLLRMEKDKEIKDLTKKIEKGKKDVQRKDSQLKNSQDSLHDLRKLLSTSNSDLKKMQIEASSQYCNVTFIKSDAKRYAGKIARSAKKKVKAMIRKANVIILSTKPHLDFMKRETEIFYTTKVYPSFETVKSEMIKFHRIQIKPILTTYFIPFYDEHLALLVIKGKEAWYSVRLSMISGLELLSKETIEYIETSRDKQTKGKSRKLQSKDEDIISALEMIGEKSSEIVDTFLKFCLVITALRIFKRPTTFVISILLLPFRVIFIPFWICSQLLRFIMRLFKND